MSKVVLILYLLCVASWFIPPFSVLWTAFDETVFFALNSVLTIPVLRPVVAVLNHNITDWMFDIVILTFFIPFLIKNRKESEPLFLFVTAVTWYGFSIWWLNRLLIPKVLHAARASPGWIFQDEMVRLTDYIHWIKIKQVAFQSFPADHGCTVLMFIFTAFALLNKKQGRIACFVSIPFILPRLICGAHWFTDIFFGSLPIILFHQWFLFKLPFFKKIHGSLCLPQKTTS
ncbi:MAG: hypothetical protein A3F09_01270 [Chlamydiae bacterium RIFCSPHIGHO2_12_FULL_49_11]|nr:MAG: hypothetical protein A3F09_01270 [Chlamydiae bacterium RIFCSPHIGHO2_12_FULL_49_11]